MINLNEFTTSWNVSLVLIFAMCLYTLVRLIYRSLPPVLLRDKFRHLVENDPQSRTAVGLGFMIFGAMDRVLLLTPISVMADAPGKQTNLLFYIESVRPFVISFGALFVYIGCCIVFWPTLLKIVYKKLGLISRKQANMAAFALAVLFQVFLLQVGYTVHHVMLKLLF